jgi:16S rRNA A1518/A1519 N6-dimethyltransferase RsmA/KsgA/DIM1 with predicted DNA glycosylase/AP lyase activity
VNAAVRTRIALGQNLFRSPQPARILLRHVSLGPGDRVYDLGAGTGMLTRELLKTGADIIAVERDPNLAAKLQQRFGRRITVIEGDLVETRFETPFKVVANLPFAVTTAALRRLLFSGPHPQEGVIVLQREAAEKYAGKRHAAVSLMLKPWYVIEIVHAFSPEDFVPRPGVETVALRVAPRDVTLLPAGERINWDAFVRYAFARSKASARQTFRNLVSNLQWRLICRDQSIAAGAVLADLSLEQWLAIYRFVQRCVPPERRRLILP